MISLLCRGFIRLIGWRLKSEGELPPKAVMIASPHTSNWDLLFMVLAAGALKLDLRWLGKEQLFTAWYGPLMRKLGGVPVERSAAHGVVGQMTELFAENDRLHLGVPASGTRSRTPHWKSGFYHIATQAGVPVIPGYIDYSRKTTGIGPAIELSGDLTTDMDQIRAFYADIKGKFPDDDGPVVLREELEAGEQAS